MDLLSSQSKYVYFTEKTEGNVVAIPATLQSELTTLKVRWEATQEEHSLLSNSVLGLETGLADTQALLDAEKRTRSQVCGSVQLLLSYIRVNVSKQDFDLFSVYKMVQSI